MRFIVTTIVALVVLTGCATRQPVWLDSQRMVTISGKDTAGLTKEAALQRMLVKSARITVEHGYRYFAFARPIPAAEGSVILQPGSDLTIRLFREGEPRYPAPGLWDAYDLLVSGRAPSPAPLAKARTSPSAPG